MRTGPLWREQAMGPRNYNSESAGRQGKPAASASLKQASALNSHWRLMACVVFLHNLRPPKSLLRWLSEDKDRRSPQLRNWLITSRQPLHGMEHLGRRMSEETRAHAAILDNEEGNQDSISHSQVEMGGVLISFSTQIALVLTRCKRLSASQRSSLPFTFRTAQPLQ